MVTEDQSSESDMQEDGQLEFSFMEDMREAARQRVKDSLVHYDNPQNDNQRLLNCQYEWIRNGDKDAEGKLWMLARKVALRMVRKEEKKRGCFFDHPTRQDKAADAVFYVLRRYSKNWFVRHSFLDALWHGVKHALDYRTKAEEMVDFVPDEVLVNIQIHPYEEPERRTISVEGMSREEVIERIRSSFLPEIAEQILAKIEIIGDKK